MIIGKRFINTLVAICTLMLVLFFTACYTEPSGAEKSVDAGSTWVVSETTRLSNLTIAEGAEITAPEGHSLTMTVDSVETSIEPGTYTGDVVLTPAEDIIVRYSGMGTEQDYRYRAAIDIENGRYMTEKSVPSAVVGGTVTDKSATDVKITSVGAEFNGIIVRGDEKFSYSIINPVISLTGKGVNDFAGYGAAIMSDGNAEVVVDNAKINNTGVVRTAVWVGGNSTTTVNNSDIEVHNGTMPEDYGWSWAAGGGGDSGDVMMEVPWMLGLLGNCRATNALGNGTAYYNDSHIKSQAWGVLSTDACRNTKLVATNCVIETVESGYGSYSDGSDNTFSGCTFNVNDYGFIITGGSGLFTDGTVVNSGRFGVMFHRGSSTVTIEKESVFNTKEAVLQVKGAKPTIVVDNASLNSKSDIILEVIENDDPNKMVPSGGQMPGGAPGGGMPGGAPGGGMPGGAPGGGMPGGPGGETPEGEQMPGGPGGEMTEGGMPGGAPGGGMPGMGGGNDYVTVTFKNSTLTGDIVTSMTAVSDVVVNLENAYITGAITTSIGEHAVGPNGEELVMQDEPDLYYLIGDVNHTYSATDDEFGIKLSLDAGSKWVVDETSYLTGLIIAEDGSISAPEGHSITMTVNGVEKPTKAGTYEGKIVLEVI